MRQLFIVKICDVHHHFGKTRITDDVETHIVQIDDSAEHEIELCPECDATILGPLRRIMEITNNVRKGKTRGRSLSVPPVVEFAQLSPSSGDRGATPPGGMLPIPVPEAPPATNGIAGLTHSSPGSDSGPEPPQEPSEKAKEAHESAAVKNRPKGRQKNRPQGEKHPCILCVMEDGKIPPARTYWKADQHMQRVHGLPLKGVFGSRCFICGQEKGSERGLTSHFVQHLYPNAPYDSMAGAFLYVRDVLGDPQGFCARRLAEIRIASPRNGERIAAGAQIIYQGAEYPCPLCTQGYDSRQEIEKHLGLTHGVRSSDVTGLTCPLDGYEASDKRKLQGHFVALHSKQFPSLLSTLVWTRDNGDPLGTYAKALASLARMNATGVVHGQVEGSGEIVNPKESH